MKIRKTNILYGLLGAFAVIGAATLLHLGYIAMADDIAERVQKRIPHAIILEMPGGAAQSDKSQFRVNLER